MANTYSSLYYHLVFSTKYRFPWLTLEIEQRVWSAIEQIEREHKMTPIQVGGVEDHVHSLVMAPPTIAPYEVAKQVKGESSLWIHQDLPWLHRFNWQDGYAAFTVSTSKVRDVVRYIKNQRELHRVKTFQDEYLELLRLNGIEYDERYVWG